MSRKRFIKTNFTAGEVSRRFIGRGDLRAYGNGALTLRNVFIHPTGGISRRAGLRHKIALPARARLFALSRAAGSGVILAIMAGEIRLYSGETLVQTLSAPWTEAQLDKINLTQSADEILIVHPDIPPRILKQTNGVWSLGLFGFRNIANVVHQPMARFADADITLTPSATTGSITLTASDDVFDSLHIGTRFRIKGKEVLINTISSPTVATATVIQPLGDVLATSDWVEQAFSAQRGWPNSVCFHQGRLVIGGSRDLPNRLFLSRTAQPNDFDLGTGLDDEAIEFTLLSDQSEVICAVISGRHLQIFTSGAEWMVTGSPLTPQTVQVSRQTRIGSSTSRNISPVSVDGATLFCGRSGRELREFIYTDVEQAYQSNDLALLARHLFNTPIDMAFDARRRILFIVMADGSAASLTLYRTEDVVAWARHDTAGFFRGVIALEDSVVFLTERDGIYAIEAFDESIGMDASITGTDGVRFEHHIAPLPPSALDMNGDGSRSRLTHVVFRVEDTARLAVDTGRGLVDVPLRRLGTPSLLDAPLPLFSGDIRVTALGWRSGGLESPWHIRGDDPLPLTILSVTSEWDIENFFPEDND